MAFRYLTSPFPLTMRGPGVSHWSGKLTNSTCYNRYDDTIKGGYNWIYSNMAEFELNDSEKFILVRFKMILAHFSINYYYVIELT